MTALGKEERFRFEESDAGRAKLMAFLNARVADMRKRLPRAFATLVPGNFEIKRMAPEVEPGAPGAYGGPGTIDGKVPGKFWINMHTMSVFTTYNTPTLTYHESIPGHVWQGEYTFKLPLCRSLLAFNAYSEGWALYAEQLANELGVYDDDPFGTPGVSAIDRFPRLPPRGRHGPARETLDPQAGHRLVRQHQWIERRRGHERGGSVLRVAGPGVRLQGRSQRDQSAARQGAEGLGRAFRPAQVQRRGGQGRRRADGHAGAHDRRVHLSPVKRLERLAWCGPRDHLFFETNLH